jgi:hypothetical protein
VAVVAQSYSVVAVVADLELVFNKLTLPQPIRLLWEQAELVRLLLLLQGVDRDHCRRHLE